MEIVHIANGDYERYEELLLQRDQLEKEAFCYQQAYTREFGELTVEAFRLKVDCISRKKSIAFYIAAKNRGESADKDQLAEFLKQQMAAYQSRLDEMIRERDSAQRGKPISAVRVGEIKKIYRRIAKLLHPDLSPLTAQYPVLADYFQRVMIAYQCNDLEELRELEVLINKVLGDNGIETVNVTVPDIGGRILALEEEIENILTTEPYLYRDLLDDVFRVQEKKDELTKEIEEYRTYKEQLEKQLYALTEGEENG